MDFSQGPDLAAVIPHKSSITSLSYHGDGVHLFAASETDSKLYLINTQTGICDHPAFRCEREGISTVQST
jgi:WD40 repeat protein